MVNLVCPEYEQTVIDEVFTSYTIDVLAEQEVFEPPTLMESTPMQQLKVTSNLVTELAWGWQYIIFCELPGAIPEMSDQTPKDKVPLKASTFVILHDADEGLSTWTSKTFCALPENWRLISRNNTGKSFLIKFVFILVIIKRLNYLFRLDS